MIEKLWNFKYIDFKSARGNLFLMPSLERAAKRLQIEIIQFANAILGIDLYVSNPVQIH
jgi:hypothetical protein